MGISVEPYISETTGAYAGSFTWATRPTASQYPAGTMIRITDVGLTTVGTMWVSNGTLWVPGSGHILLAQSYAAVTAPANDTNENTLATISIPGGLIGTDGKLRFVFGAAMTNNANAKTWRVKLGGTTFGGATMNSAANGTFTVEISNRAASNSQYSRVTAQVNTALTTATATGSVDTTADTTFIITAQKATGTDTMTLEGYSLELMRLI